MSALRRCGAGPAVSAAATCAASAPRKTARTRQAMWISRVSTALNRRRSATVLVGVVTVARPRCSSSGSRGESWRERARTPRSLAVFARAAEANSSGAPALWAAPQIHAAVRSIAVRSGVSHGASATARTRGVSGHPAPRTPGPQCTSVPRMSSARCTGPGRRSCRGTPSGAVLCCGAIRAGMPRVSPT